MEEADGELLELGPSAHELLREKDFAEMTPDEFHRLRRLIQTIARTRPRALLTPPRARSTRRRARHAAPAAPLAATGGDVVDCRTARARTCPASSSCCATCPARWMPTRARCCYSPARRRRLRARRRGVRVRDAAVASDTRPRHTRSGGRDRALHRGGRRLGGGTRIGASLKQFNDVYGRRALSAARSSSSSRTAGSATIRSWWAARWRRLARAAYAVAWVNPLKGNPSTSRSPAECARRSRTSTGSCPDII